MSISIARARDIQYEVKNGYGEVEVLPGGYPLVHGYKCVLKDGYDLEPEVYSDKIAVYCFTKGTGYITDGLRAYNIDELSFYIPDFTRKFMVHATSDMEIMKIVTDMLESDHAAYEDTHMVLPSFKTFSETEPYDQSCKGPHTRSWSVIHSGNLARVLMGIVCAEGEGTIEKGHPSVAQFNYALDGADFNLTVDGETTTTEDGDWSYVTAGLDHSLVAESGKKVFYIWFEHKVAEWKNE